MAGHPLFILGTARSGSTLLAKVLDAHRALAVASDPFFTLLRMFRNAAVAADGRVPPGAFRPEEPLQDYYFRHGQDAVVRAMLEASLDLPCDPAAWEASYASRLARLSHECPDLAPLLPRMRGGSFRELLSAGLDLVLEGRKPSAARVGIKEVWFIEYVPSLLRAWPDAKILVISRDPRGVVASMLTLRDAGAHAHVLSYLRHWRKFVAFLAHYREQGLFGARLMHLRFEDFVRDPEPHSRDICSFLGVDFDPGMLDPERLWDYGAGRPWRGNASSEQAASGVSADFVDNWRGVLDRPALALCEFAAGADMELLGYRPTLPAGRGFPLAEAYAGALRDHGREHNWRTDSGDLMQDFGYELARQALQGMPEAADAAAVRRAFLLDAAWRALLGRKGIPCNRGPGGVA